VTAVPGDVPDEELAHRWHDIVRACARVQRLLDHDVEAGGVPAQWVPVLELLLAAPEHRLPMSALARELAMTSGGFSKLADRMATDGLIDRRGATDDRRVVHAALTDAGLATARQARSAYLAALRRRLSGVTGADLAAAAAVLTRLEGADGRDQPEVTDQVAGERDPALPDRRGRGRRSGPTAH
jgi:DNA-binding MarR family transcriptional regulator